jgi:hypothetical protein
MSNETAAAGIYAGLELLKLGYELVKGIQDNPGETDAQVAARVEATQVKARITVDEWRTLRRSRAGP